MKSLSILCLVSDKSPYTIEDNLIIKVDAKKVEAIVSQSGKSFSSQDETTSYVRDVVLKEMAAFLIKNKYIIV